MHKKVIDLSFTKRDWTNQSLSAQTVSGCTFEYVKLVDSKVYDLIFEDCKFSSVDFTDAVLDNVTFIDCILVDCQFVNSQLNDCKFRDCQVLHTIALGSNWQSVTMSDCDLVGVSLAYSSISKCAWENTNLLGVGLFAVKTVDSTLRVKELVGADVAYLDLERKVIHSQLIVGTRYELSKHIETLQSSGNVQARNLAGRINSILLRWRVFIMRTLIVNMFGVDKLVTDHYDDCFVDGQLKILGESYSEEHHKEWRYLCWFSFIGDSPENAQLFLDRPCHGEHALVDEEIKSLYLSEGIEGLWKKCQNLEYKITNQ